VESLFIFKGEGVLAFRADGNVSPLASRAYLIGLTAPEHKIEEMKGNSSSTSIAGALFSPSGTRPK